MRSFLPVFIRLFLLLCLLGTATADFEECTRDEQKKEKEEEGLDGGAIAGIAVAVGIILLALLAGLAVLLYLVIRSKSKMFMSDQPFVELNLDPIRWPESAPHIELAKSIILENNGSIEEQTKRFMEKIQKMEADNALRAVEQAHVAPDEKQRSFSETIVTEAVKDDRVEAKEEEKLKRKMMNMKRNKHWRKVTRKDTVFGDDTTNTGGAEELYKQYRVSKSEQTQEQNDEKKPDGPEEEEGDVFAEDDEDVDSDDDRQPAGKEEEEKNEEKLTENKENEKKENKEQEIRSAHIFYSVRNPIYPFFSRRDNKLRKVAPEEHIPICECVDGCENEESREPYRTRIVGARWEKKVDDCLNLLEDGVTADYIHERFLIGLDVPIVYEQQFRYTAREMSELPLHQANSVRDHFIDDAERKSAFGIKSIPWKNGFKEKPKEERMYAEPMTPGGYLLEVYVYQKGLDKYNKEFSQIAWKARTRKGFDEGYLKAIIDALIASPAGETVLLTSQDILQICNMAKQELQKSTDAQVYIDDSVPIRVIGEVRGKFKDLRRTINFPSKICTELKTHPILYYRHIFLGNYIGGGQYNIDTVAFVLALKGVLKDRCVLLRGAMEWRQMNRNSNFFSDLKARFPSDYEKIYEAINDVFDYLPLACKIGDKIFCTHGGISPGMELLENIQLPLKELLPDTLPFNMTFARPNITVKRYFDNVDSRAGYYFGEMVFYETVKRLGVEAMIVAMPLRSGWGNFGHKNKLYGLASAMMLEGSEDHPSEAWAALAEVDGSGAIIFKMFYLEDMVIPRDNQEDVDPLNSEEKIEGQTADSKESKESTGATEQTTADKDTKTPAAQNQTPNKP